MKKINSRGRFITAIAAFVIASAPVWADHFDGFEDPAWAPGGNSWRNYDGGDIVQVASGTNGVTSSSGSYHAELTNLSNVNNVFGVSTLGAVSPYSVLGGYSSDFGSGFTVSLDIYLDPANWANGDGFDLATAVSRQDGNHLRDFIWHVGVVNDNLLVNASNNSDLSLNTGRLLNNGNLNEEGNYTVVDEGWYTFATRFYDNGGMLAVDFNLFDSTNTLLHSITRETNDDIATVVGGNRYAWFTFNNIDHLAIDNTTLTNAVVPVPGAAGLGLLGMALLGVHRRFRKSA